MFTAMLGNKRDRMEGVKEIKRTVSFFIEKKSRVQELDFLSKVLRPWVRKRGEDHGLTGRHDAKTAKRRIVR